MKLKIVKKEQDVIERTYPYLAILDEEKTLTIEEVLKLEHPNIVLISKIPTNPFLPNGIVGKCVYHLSGNKGSYFTMQEEMFFRLPKGYSVELCN